MSLFEVNTEELNNLANQLKDISGLLRDGDGIPVINRSLGTIRSFFGFNMSTHKGNLSSVYSTMRDLSNDLMKLGTALSAIARYSQDADIQAFSIFANIPMHVITKVNLIGDFDITKGFLNTRNSTADAVTIGLTRNWLDNGIGIIGKGMEIISGGNAKIGKTADEEIMIDSIESLLKSSCDTPNQLMENIESLFKKMSPEEYENFMKVLKTVVSTGKTLTEAEVYESFHRITPDRMVIFSSHRLSSCRFCRQILVFDHGRLIQSGNHKALIEQDGMYKTLWQAQAQFYQ